MAQHDQVRYPLGSQRRWLEALFLLVAPAAIVSSSLFVLSGKLPFLSRFVVAVVFFAAAVSIQILYGVDQPETHTGLSWLSDLTVNLAHGWADDEGIHFRKWFRLRFVSWKAIERVEYWPERGDRIDLHLYSQRSLVTFLPDRSPSPHAVGMKAGHAEIANFIGWKLKQAWPGHSPFLISIGNMGTSNTGALAKMLKNLNDFQQALANISVMFLGVLFCVAVVAIRIASGSYYAALLIFYGLLVVLRIGALVFLRRSLPLDKPKAANGQKTLPGDSSCDRSTTSR